MIGLRQGAGPGAPRPKIQSFQPDPLPAGAPSDTLFARMATVRYFPNDGPPILTALHKPVTTLGRALGNDIHLSDVSVAHHHAQIVFNGRDFQLEELDRDGEILINGKKKRRARLANGDRFTLNKSQLGFSFFTEVSTEPKETSAIKSEKSDIEGIRRLQAFSERLMTSRSVEIGRASCRERVCELV